MTNKSLLRSSMEWGADEAVGDVPRNYFAAPKMPEKTTSPTHELKHVTMVPTQPDPALRRGYASLPELEAAVRAFDGCSLKKTAQKTVFADGNPKASLMIIGEAPGADEDVQGIPFCGVSGKLLDKMLAAIGLDRTSVYITNTVFWRPPGNRQPNMEETALCLPFVEQHIALIAPKLLLLAGGVATKTLLGRDESMSRLRGKTYQYQNSYLQAHVQTLVTYHPSYLLRQPSQKRATWQDMLMIQSLLNC